MRSVFVDTVALLGLVNVDDQIHSTAQTTYLSLLKQGSRLITSDWVLCEFLNGSARTTLRNAAINAVERMRSSQLFEIVAASHEGWNEAYDLYRARGDKKWSFVDCSSILICQEKLIPDVLTADHHFQQAGLNILLR